MATQIVAVGAETLGTPTGDDDIHVIGGSATIDTNMDWSGVTQAAVLEVSGGFNGQFGTAAAPFKGRVSSRFVYAASGGDAYWVSDGSASDISPRLLHIGGGHLHFETTGTITAAEIAHHQATFTVATAVTVTNLYLAAGTVYVYDDGSTDPTLIEQHGGSLFLERGATTLIHSKGQTTIDAGTNAFTTISIYGPGVSIEDSGTITTLNAYGGLPDVSELARPLTISTTNINLALPGAREFLNNPLITFSSTNEFLGR